MSNSASSDSYASYLASHNDNPYHLSHIWEFKELATRIAQEQIFEIVPPLVESAVSKTMNAAFAGAMKGIEIDVNRIVDVTIQGLNKQFHSEEVDKFLAEALGESLRSALSKMDFNLIIS